MSDSNKDWLNYHEWAVQTEDNKYISITGSAEDKAWYFKLDDAVSILKKYGNQYCSLKRFKSQEFEIEVEWKYSGTMIVRAMDKSQARDLAYEADLPKDDNHLVEDSFKIVNVKML